MREEASNVSEGATGRRVRRLLVVSEVALGVVLTIGAALLVRSFVNLTHVDPGFDQRNLLTTTISVYKTGHAPEGRRLAFYDDVASRLRALPGVAVLSETLEEIAIEGKATYLKAGGREFHAIPCLNERDDWIHALTDIIVRNLLGWEHRVPPEQLERSRLAALAMGARN